MLPNPRMHPTRLRLRLVARVMRQPLASQMRHKLKAKIFYSWQSDTKAASNRSFIQNALESAAKDLREDESISVDPVIDRDTLAMPGSPDIGSTIFEKIDNCEIFVADVTIINSGSNERPSPNPNVLIELGYALKALGSSRIIIVQNTAFGGPETLPFDLRQKRILPYHSAEDAPNRAEERKRVQKILYEAISLVLAEGDFAPSTQCPVNIEIKYKKIKSSQKRHDYQLHVSLKNISAKPITEWHVDVGVPTWLLSPSVTYHLNVPERSDSEQSLFRSTNKTHAGVIYPGDSKLVLSMDYYIDDAIYSKMHHKFSQKIIATAYVHGELSATSEKTISSLQDF